MPGWPILLGMQPSPRKICLTACLLALHAPSIAPADSGLPTSQPIVTKRVAVSLTIAERFWGRPAPCHVRVYQVPRARMTVNGLSYHEWVEHGGPECPVWISDDYTANDYAARTRFCTLLVHAVGHMLGRLDNDNPASIMYGPGGPISYGCYRRFVPRGKRREWRMQHSGGYATR